MQPARDPPALDPRLQADQCHQPKAGKQCRVDRRLDALNRTNGILPHIAERQDRADPEEHRRSHQNQSHDQATQPPDRPRQDGNLVADAAGKGGDFARHLRQSPVGKALPHPAFQGFAGLQDLRGVKAAKGHGAGIASLTAAAKCLSHLRKYPLRSTPERLCVLHAKPRDKESSRRKALNLTGVPT